MFLAMELVIGQPLGALLQGPPRAALARRCSPPTATPRPRARRRARQGHRAPRREARQHPARRGRPRARGRLRPGGGRVRAPGGTGGAGSSQARPTDLSDTVPARSDSGGGLDGDGRLTATGALLGTPLYKAPGAVRGVGGEGPASDQHSLCTALYEGLYGELPFAVTAEGSPNLMIQVLSARKKEGPLPSLPPAGSPVPPSILPGDRAGPRPATGGTASPRWTRSSRRSARWRRAGRGLRNAVLGAVAILAARNPRGRRAWRRVRRPLRAPGAAARGRVGRGRQGKGAGGARRHGPLVRGRHGRPRGPAPRPLHRLVGLDAARGLRGGEERQAAARDRGPARRVPRPQAGAGPGPHEHARREGERHRPQQGGTGGVRPPPRRRVRRRRGAHGARAPARDPGRCGPGWRR